ASLNRTESDFLPGEIFWATGIGGNLVSTQLRPIRIDAGYSLGLSKGAAASVAPVGRVGVGLPEAGELQTAQRVNLNLASRTLAPYTVTGDYRFVLERGVIDRQTHTASVQGTGSPFSGLSFRALLQGSIADNPDITVLTGDLSATYSPRYNLSLTGGVSASLVEADDQSTSIIRIPLVVRYQLGRNTLISLEGFHEDIINTLGPDRLSHEARLRVEQLFRRFRLSLEFRFRDSNSGSSRRQEAQFLFTIDRPFAFSF
ncbi:MAG: hypothetical protein ACE5G5_09150, partial [Candidatus Methylomirabilales bacterium]